jgi:hypothetical protein
MATKQAVMRLSYQLVFKMGGEIQHRSGKALRCWCDQRLLLLCFGFGEQRVGMTVNEFPGAVFAAEEFGYA